MADLPDPVGRTTSVVTGGDSGIGRAIAIAYAREGADVVIAYLPGEEDDALETISWVERAGRRSLKVPGDIRHERHCRDLVEKTVEEFGALDILVNNAAFQMSHEKLEEFSSEECDRTFRTNIYAMFYLAKAAQPAELAHACFYLASDESSYVTGSVMDLTGGSMLP